jgi:hypothetical protein
MWTFGCRAHDHDHYRDDDEYHITPRDIAFGFLTFMIILSNLQVRMYLVVKTYPVSSVLWMRIRS